MDENAKRDYKAEYKKFQSSTKSKKYRAELNKYNRKKGTYGNGDGKDASHSGGKIVGFESQSKNRGRAEKSRMKKESQVNELVPPMSVSNPAAYKAMLDKEIAKNVKVKTALGNKSHKDHKKAKSLYQRFMDKFKKKKGDKPKKAAPKKQSKSDADFYKRQFTGESIIEINGVKYTPLNEAASWGQVKTFLLGILRKKQAKKMDGYLVDMNTANAILKVGNALNQSNQKKYGKLPIKKMAAIAWKLVK